MTRFRRQRLRSRLSILALVALLWSQAVFAAHPACALAVMALSDAVAMDADCASMEMHQVGEAPALCAKHCAPDQSLVPENPAPGVLTLALPPPAYALVLSTQVGSMACETRVPVVRSDPPPRLRYCSLLI